ncbi:MAG: hypothetical protein IJD97_08275 [Clostridia bacterium]|nr:hypothetical protein [Clostridia bacterium]
MKKNIFIGILSPLFYFLSTYLMLLWEYNESFAIIQDVMLIALPALPGVALAIFLIRNSLMEFLKSLGICFISSICFTFILTLLPFTGLLETEKIGLGEGFLIAITSTLYIISCTIGCVIAAILSFVKQKRMIIQKTDMNS